MRPEHTVMVIQRGETTETVSRPGHIELRAMLDFAKTAGGKLVTARHLRTPAAPGPAEVVRIIQGQNP